MDGSNTKKRISEYIKKNLEKGYSLESLRWTLINQGYPRTSVDAVVFEMKNKSDTKAKPQITHEFFDDKNKVVKSIPPKKSFWSKFFGF